MPPPPQKFPSTHSQKHQYTPDCAEPEMSRKRKCHRRAKARSINCLIWLMEFEAKPNIRWLSWNIANRERQFNKFIYAKSQDEWIHILHYTAPGTYQQVYKQLRSGNKRNGWTNFTLLSIAHWFGQAFRRMNKWFEKKKQTKTSARPDWLKCTDAWNWTQCLNWTLSLHHSIRCANSLTWTRQKYIWRMRDSSTI